MCKCKLLLLCIYSYICVITISAIIININIIIIIIIVCMIIIVDLNDYEINIWSLGVEVAGVDDRAIFIVKQEASGLGNIHEL